MTQETEIAADLSTPRLTRRAPGIYFGLDEDAYHADAALGSGDMRDIAQSPENWWFNSRYNPNPEEDDDERESEALIVGKAFHLCALEGRERFERAYAPTDLKGNTKEGKAERAAIIESGRIPIRRKYFRRALIASAIVRGNPHLSNAWESVLATELSIFWEDGGIPKKARIDILKPRAIVDLKTIVPREDKTFVEHCRDHIASYRLHVQAAHYLQGRDQIRALAEEQKIYGTFSDSSFAAMREKLLRVTEKPAAFVLIFIQKSSAPLSWGTTFSPGNPILEYGRQVLLNADDNWRKYSASIGLSTPWLESLPLEEACEDDFKPWAFR